MTMQPTDTEAKEEGRTQLYPIAERELTCAHPSCASPKIANGSNYFSSSLGPMHPQCSWQSIPIR